ncbi:MAG: tetratricopeptide repeat protein [Gammaproteobacteria bacterium]|nr:tetratricopeptide repeat protein [Gammaproteobacteria bacterium]
MPFRTSRLLLIILTSLTLVYPAYGDEFSQARKLLKQNKTKQAYDFLVKEEGYHMGEPDFDLLLAQTALKARLWHEAIFAFERVLIHNPGNVRARVEMAIAYFQIKEYENAERHLDMVIKAKPSEEIRVVLEKYKEQINETMSARRHRFSGFHQFKQGWDSNINSATNESEIRLNIPGGSYRPVEGVSKQTDDTFSELVNRINYEYQLSVNSHFTNSLGYSIRENNNEKFDTQNADISIAYSRTTGFGKFSIPLSYQASWLDEKELRNIGSIGLSLNRSGTVFTQYAIQYGEVRYPGQKALDVDQVVYSYVIGTNDNTSRINQLYALFYGDETERDSVYKFNAREYMGLQLKFPMRLTSQQYVTPRLVYQESRYKQQHPFFFQSREDKHSSFNLNWDWYLSQNLQLNGQVGHSVNNSTVDLYTYDRNTIFVGTTYKY